MTSRVRIPPATSGQSLELPLGRRANPGQSLLAPRDGRCLAPGPMTHRGRSTENPPADAPDEADAKPPTQIRVRRLDPVSRSPTRT